MRSLVAVDTNVLVRLVVRDDERQVAAAEAFVRRGVWASNVLVVEMAWVLKAVYGFDHEAIAAAIDMLLQERHLAL